MSRKRPAWCSVSTPVIWSSTTITSSAWPCHWRANMPMAAEPQPARMRSSRWPSTTGAAPAWTTSSAPPSTVSVAGLPLQRSSRAAQVTVPSRLVPPVKCRTPPSESICEPYSAVVTWPMGSPSARTEACSGPTWRSVSIFTFTPQ